MNKVLWCILLSTQFVITPVGYSATTPGTELQFSGTLVADPCTVAPDDENIDVEITDIIDKYLYINTRTHSKPFSIHLQDCDVETGETVVTRFEGTESTELPGYLAMTDASIGAAVGIEESDGTFLGINKNSRAVQLSDGSVGVNFKAFVEGEPEAIKNKTVKLGEFTAVATFFLVYP
ncbi:fimbrial protein [Klebsiella aerogenes]